MFKKVIYSYTLLIVVIIFSCSSKDDPIHFDTKNDNRDLISIQLSIPTIDSVSVSNHGDSLKLKSLKNGFNRNFCFLIDMKMHSGIKRFYVWDFNLNQITSSGLLSHGCGQNPWCGDLSKENPKFSNEEGTHLSSLGKYRLGSRGTSQFGVGVKYLLHGLDSTNSNALSRYIVFHSWEKVGDSNCYPKGTAEGWGCPAVSNQYFNYLDSLIRKESNQKIMMWIYN
jgi:hypothetical protein